MACFNKEPVIDVRLGRVLLIACPSVAVCGFRLSCFFHAQFYVIRLLMFK